MKQHPVPQNISSYEFKLVGDMTLKQFFQLAGGAIVALIFYASPIPGIIKWPLVFLFGALGAALAFLPIEERPLSTWIFAFLKAVYSPTKYVFVASTSEDVFAKTKTVAPVGPIPQSTINHGAVSTFEEAERNFFQKVSVLFQTSSPGQVPIPNYTPQAREPLPQGTILEMHQVQAPQQPVQEQPVVNRPSFKVVEEVDIPKIQPIKVGQNLPQQPNQPTSQTQPLVKPLSPVFTNQAASANLKQATFTPQAAPPSPPTIPNTVTGQVLSIDGKIIDGAILEIKDLSGKPVRAIRTNKVGHFLTVTPLQDGDYQIETEKEGFAFDPVKFKAEGKFIQPIQIKAK